ncbi:tripartite tricarboxylate transporter substrate binding protein [Variovorax sp. J22G21]|uniref:tripartite tricarboxylate transporter substrate binding protein n=1 Tax=Variovorax fucosicus TaxID=3053517 RepID=UPI002576276F|nr:tripartite tricarboxylate transporter substrate binding protein [Variovorax sp. J22G21]MDM0041343.1 tripartite tricarboxylate transporter substrate binding protein [Variovorax sp. J22R193]MDM0060400.1 tripartite tricarboxylate transporter substrate binding protein [Variovorax sp. J22G21]
MKTVRSTFLSLLTDRPAGHVPRIAATARRAVAVAALAASAALSATAQTTPNVPGTPFPGGPTTLIVPYAAGGLTDNLARALGQRLAERWGQPVVVDNRAGGGTVIGTATAARATPDGRTLLVTSFGFTANQFMVPNLPYRQSALEPLAMIAVAPAILFVHPSVPADDVPSLVRYMRTSGKPFSFASSGNGSSPHIGAELFASRIGVSIVHVPYRGNGPGLNDLVGGQVQGMFDSKAALSFVKAGKLKALGISSLKPSALAPDLKPIAQSGVPELATFTTASWFGVLVPEATPKPIQNRLYADIRAVLDMPDMREAIDRAGVEPLPLTQPEFAAYLKSEAERWGPLIREKNIKAD